MFLFACFAPFVYHHQPTAATFTEVNSKQTVAKRSLEIVGVLIQCAFDSFV